MPDKYFLDVAGTKKLIEKTVNAGGYIIYIDITPSNGAGLPEWIDSSGNISNSAQHIHFYRGKNALAMGVDGNSNLVEIPTSPSAPNTIPAGFNIDHCIAIIHRGATGAAVDEVLRPVAKHYNIHSGRPIIFASFGPNNTTYSLSYNHDGQWDYSTNQTIDKVIAKIRITNVGNPSSQAIEEIPLNNAVLEDENIYYTTPGNTTEYSLSNSAGLIFENWKKSELQLTVDGELWNSFLYNSTDPNVYNPGNDDLADTNKTIILRPNMAGHFELLADSENPESVLYTSEPFEMEDRVFVVQVGLEYDSMGRNWDHGYGPNSIDFCLLEAIDTADVSEMLEDD